MLHRFVVLAALLGVVTTLVANPPIAVRLVSFDPTVRQVGKLDAQQATLALVSGRKAGKPYPVFLAPSEKTAGFVGQQLYLRQPLNALKKKDAVFFAGELLDVEPTFIPPDFSVSIPFKEGKQEAYFAGRIALDRINEINGAILPTSDPAQWLKAPDAITTAAKAYPGGVQGTFVFAVKGSGTEAGTVWLNSESDYKDPQSLNVRIPWRASQDFKLRHQAEIGAFLKGRTIVVTGIAERVKIETKPGKFYYQTQVDLWSLHQLRVVD